MERPKLTDDEAFELLVKASQQTNTKLADVAGYLVETGELVEERPSGPAARQLRRGLLAGLPGRLANRRRFRDHDRRISRLVGRPPDPPTVGLRDAERLQQAGDAQHLAHPV